jgi:hypothetical protein
MQSENAVSVSVKMQSENAVSVSVKMQSENAVSPSRTQTTAADCRPRMHECDPKLLLWLQVAGCATPWMKPRRSKSAAAG